VTAPVPSYAQVRRLRALAAEQADGLDPTGKTIPLLFAVPGELDVPALEEAVGRLIARHPALHHRFTDFPDDRMPALAFAGPARVRCDVTVATDLVADPTDRDALDAAVVRRIRAEVDRPFDALGWPLLRFGVVRADQSLVYVSLDHLVADAWSQWAVMLELSALYDAVRTGRADPLPPAPDFYAFSAAQRRRFDAGPALRAPVAALRRSLRDRPLHPRFPLDVPWDDDRGRYVRRQLLGPDEVQRLSNWCREHRATLFMAVLGAFGTALRQVGGATEVGVLIATHNRDEENVRGGIGWYANMLPVYFPVGDDPTGTVAGVRRALIATLEFHELPLARAVDVLPPDQADDGHPTCFVSMTDDRTGQRQDGPRAPDGPVDPETAWRRMAIAPAHRRGYGIWISLMDEGLIVSTASPAVRGDAADLDELETAFGAALRRMAG
jgi:hypothetical protein